MSRLVAVLLVLLVPAFAKDKKKDPDAIGQRDVGKGVNFYSLEKEIALGKQLAAEVQREAKMLEDPLITEYVNRVGQNLVRNSDAKVPFTFQVIDGEPLNAFALPGGFVFVYSGLMKVAETEAEMASAMAHEIAHVAARHMTRQATRSQIINILSVPLAMIGGWSGYAIRQGAGVGIPMGFLKFDRAFEEEADYLGTQYLYAAGYDPNASIDLFERMMSLEKRRPGTIAKVFSTHPLNSSRLKKTQQEINEILPGKPAYVVNTSEYIEMRERLLALDQRAKPEEKEGPRLRRTPGSSTPVETKEDKDDRPTLKRRDLVE